MHIKQVIISGFRSFRSQGEIEAFSPTTNCVVGRNGSGKSNLFDSIQFVLLAPKFVNLRQEERQALLHEGAGTAVMSAFVEVVFDNSDSRLAVEGQGDEVVLRRTVGLKKDEFFLNRKRVQRNEVMSLLESAGFSKSNPYFIVQQGKVNALCLMADSERLALLKEVAGTTVYDEKRKASLEQMSTNQSEMTKITEVISYINTRLDELEGEKEELAAYQGLDRSRRALEYTLHDRELRKAREKLDQVEYERAEAAESLSSLHEAARTTHDLIRAEERSLAQDAAALRRARKDAVVLEGEAGSAVAERTRLEMEVRELRERVRSDEAACTDARGEMKRVRAEIDRTRTELDGRAMPRYDAARRAAEDATLGRDRCVRDADALYAKQGRGRAYRTEVERDAALRAQIADLRSAAKKKEAEISSKEDLLASSRRSVVKEAEDLKHEERSLAQRSDNLARLATVSAGKQTERNALAEDRRVRWRDLEEIADKLHDSRDGLRRATQDLRKSMSRATGVGLENLARIVAEENVRGYYGPVVENLELIDDKYRTAVEVCAGDSFFHVIVDTDSTAAKLMTRLEKEKLGRVTFLPLNRLDTPQVQYPDSTDVVPVINRCIRFDSKVSRAMRHIFSRKLLAKDNDSAALWSDYAGMDAVTVHGDEVNRKGALTGGYHDQTKSRLGAFASVKSATRTVETLEASQRELQAKTNAVDQTISSLQSEIQEAERKQARLRTVMEQSNRDIAAKRVRIEKRAETENELEAALPTMRADAEGWKSQVLALDAEIGTKLSSTLSEAEREQLEGLLAQQKDLEKNLEKASAALAEVSVEKERLSAHLKDNLLRRQSELEESLNPVNRADAESAGAQMAERKFSLEQEEAELRVAETAADKLTRKLDEVKKIESQRYAATSKAKVELDRLNGVDMENRAKLEAATDTAESHLNKRSMWVSKREEYMGKIQELGSIPSSDLPAHVGKSIKELMKGLDGVNKKLKKYSHVNKKAYDQYVNFSEQREELLVRKQELDRGAEKVQELVDSLDRQKDEAINRTFNGVSMHFKDVWKELVPSGEGRLIMRTAIEDDEQPQTDGGVPDVNMYRGVQVEVKFSSGGENYLMSQLSGGQKALVAMGLIFAIQRCDPAPFYLFDELDQALDSSYRASVASLIQRQANIDPNNPTQFICSTFRPELVQVANRCFGISHQNKVSNIHVLSKTDALGFISNLMGQEEAVGEVSTAPSNLKSSAATEPSGRDARKNKRSRPTVPKE